MSSSYLSDLDHKRIQAKVHKDRVIEKHYISDIDRGIRRKAEKKTWKVKELIGRGSFSHVRLEVCMDGDNPVQERAVKQITLMSIPTTANSDQSSLRAKQYENELKALLEFSKPKYKEMSVFVEFLGWFDDGFDVFLAMEYLRLGDLERNLPANGTLPESEAKVITKQILDALNIMHMESFAHRDLKPQNVLVVQGSPNWWIKLADFGLTKRFTESTQFNTQAGTLAYMAPEVLDKGGKNSAYTYAVDIWALGCIVFRLLTGSVPFPSALKLSKYYDGLNIFPSGKLIDSNVSFSSADLMMQLLKACPEERPTACQALQHRWLPSDVASLRGSEISRASTDSERSTLPEEIPCPIEDHKSRSFLNAPASTKGYNTSTNPALKSLGDEHEKDRDKSNPIYELDQEGNSFIATAARPSQQMMTPGPLMTLNLPTTQDRQNLSVLPGSPKISAEESLPSFFPVSEMLAEQKLVGRAPDVSLSLSRASIDRDNVNTQIILKNKTGTSHIVQRSEELQPVPKTTGTDSQQNHPTSNENDLKKWTSSPSDATVRARSLSSTRMEEANKTVKWCEDDDSPKEVKELKAVPLTGIFSVSTTTSKPILEIQNDIIKVLQRIRVEFTKIQGGFKCRHSLIILSFKILIVKVPLVALHGIQFKRLDGDTWNYKSIVSDVLRGLKAVNL